MKKGFKGIITITLCMFLLIGIAVRLRTEESWEMARQVLSWAVPGILNTVLFVNFVFLSVRF